VIEARFSLTKPELTRTVREQLVRSANFVLLCVLALAGLVFGVVIGDTWAIAAFVACVGIALVLAVAMPEIGWRRYSGLADGETVYSFTDDGVDMATASIRSTVGWDAITGATGARDVYVLNISGNRRVIVPRRAFASPGDEQAFRELVERRTGSKL
jgi:hypothetical protein